MLFTAKAHRRAIGFSVSSSVSVVDSSGSAIERRRTCKNEPTVTEDTEKRLLIVSVVFLANAGQ